MQVMSFIVFVVVAAVGTSGVGYAVTLLTEPAASRRCRAPREAVRRRRAHGRRVRCRLEG